jgi:hypothetical protein
MEKKEDIKLTIQKLKLKLSEEKKTIDTIDTLIHQRIDRDVDLWEYNDSELDKEIWNRFFLLKEYSDCLSKEKIVSQRKKIGWIIVLIKKIFRKITAPYSQLLLDRQKRFNQELTIFLLASILRLQMIHKRLAELETTTYESIKNQKEFQDELTSLKKSILIQLKKTN